MKNNFLFIYGAGAYGMKLFSFFQSIGCKVDGFVQTEEPEYHELLGLKLFSFKTFRDQVESQHWNKEEISIAVAIRDEKANWLVSENLIQIGIPWNHIGRYKEFLENNSIYRKKEIKNGVFSCNVCDIENIMFDDFPALGDARFFEEHRMIGAGDRKNCICPVCGSIDRNRFVFWVLQNKTDIFDTRKTVLHFAPEYSLYQILKNKKNLDYYPCDLFPKMGIHTVDATDIPFRDSVFDFIIINHVLEHIPDEAKALHELYRVLKPNGTVLITVPIASDLTETFEDPHILSKEERSRYYGQSDHVRLYGLDYIKRFSNVGFKITEYTPDKEMNEDLISKFRFIHNDVVMLCRK